MNGPARLTAIFSLPRMTPMLGFEVPSATVWLELRLKSEAAKTIAAELSLGSFSSCTRSQRASFDHIRQTHQNRILGRPNVTGKAAAPPSGSDTSGPCRGRTDLGGFRVTGPTFPLVQI